MIKLDDWLINYNPLDTLYALSHSQYVEDSGGKRGEPYRISRLNVHLFANVRDCLHNFRQEKWQIVFIGSFSKCVERQSDLGIMKKWSNEELEDWEKKTFVEYCEDKNDIDHDQVVLNDFIDEMFGRDIKELIPGVMASAVPGVAWSAATCTLDGERAFKITGRFTEADGNVLEGRFMIYQRVILDVFGEGKGWAERCKVTVMGQIQEKIGRQA